MAKMTSNKPYLVRAIWSWITDNKLTPYLMVDATHPKAYVPQEYVNDGVIVLNLSESAVEILNIANSSITFTASFNQIRQEIYIPMKAVKAIYAKENGDGMAFDGNDSDDDYTDNEPPPEKPSGPTLTVVK